MKIADCKVFLVDDSIFCLHFYAEILHNVGFHNISMFENGESCLNNLNEQPQVVFLDLCMDNLGGEEVLHQIKHKIPQTYVVILSSNNDLNKALQLLGDGAFDYILKGENDLERIKNVLHKIQLQQELTYKTSIIEKQHLEIKAQHTRLQESIRAALKIQQFVLPLPEKCAQILGDYFVWYQPKDIVSGDFYWVEEIDNIRYVACVDCIGHGVSGAFMTLITNQIMQNLLIDKGLRDPAAIVNRLDIEIRKAVRQDQTQADVGIDISLLAIGRQDEYTHKITFAGAKNSFHYILPESQELITVEGNKKSLGSVFHQEKLCIAQTLVLPVGSLLYLFTDGLYHQNDLQNKKFSKKRLLDLIEKNSVYPLSIQKTLFEETFEAYKIGVFQRDDVLLMGFRL